MKRAMFWMVQCIAISSPSFAQAPSGLVITSDISNKPGLPQYLVYRYFLAWVNALDRQAIAAGATDPYQFAQPFASHAGRASADLDVLRNEARALESDLGSQDAGAAGAITAFRARASAAARAGERLPSVPPEIQQLQRARTASLVQHYLTLRAGLGTATSSRLDQYLDREFAPHLSMKRVVSGQIRVSISSLLPTFARVPQ